MRDFPALVLNADFRPLSRYPLSTLKWQDAITAVFKDHVTVVAEYDKEVHSPSRIMRLPSVVAVRDYVTPPKRVAFTRFNVLLRDKFHCQYCGKEFPSSELTFDHVLPKSKGGETCWDNIVAACDPCNLRKGNKTEMKPLRWPRVPTPYDLMSAKREFPPGYLHETWLDFLYWDSEIEP